MQPSLDEKLALGAILGRRAVAMAAANDRRLTLADRRAAAAEELDTVEEVERLLAPVQKRYGAEVADQLNSSIVTMLRGFHVEQAA